MQFSLVVTGILGWQVDPMYNNHAELSPFFGGEHRLRSSPMRWFRARWWQCHALSVWQCSNNKSTWQLQVASCFNVWHCRYQFFIWKHFFCACEHLVPIISFSPVFSLIVVFHRPNMVYFSIHPGKFQTFAKHIVFWLRQHIDRDIF